jgi:hypothetical protein
MKKNKSCASGYLSDDYEDGCDSVWSSRSYTDVSEVISPSILGVKELVKHIAGARRKPGSDTGPKWTLRESKRAESEEGFLFKLISERRFLIIACFLLITCFA